MEKTVFEKIVDGDIGSWKVYEDETVLALLDITPVNKGHVLVIPKKRYASIFDTPEELFGHIMIVAKRIAIALKATLHAEGINIVMNNEKAGGHVTDHAHVHVIPRFTGDGLGSWEGKFLYEEGEMATYADTIKNGI